MTHEHERPIAVAFLQLSQRPVRCNVRYITGIDLLLTHLAKDRIMIDSLAQKHIPIFEAGRFAGTTVGQMPFSYNRSLITIVL